MHSVSEPARADFAAISTRIEALTRKLPKLRERAADSSAALRAANAVLHRVSAMKHDLVSKHHAATMATPLSSRSRRRTSSLTSTQTSLMGPSPSPTPRSPPSLTSITPESPEHAGLQFFPASLQEECNIVAMPDKEALHRLQHLTEQLRQLEPKLQRASDEWRRCVVIVCSLRNHRVAVLARSCMSLSLCN